MPSFAYDEPRAAAKHDALDRTLGQIENRVNRLKEIVPGAGAIPTRLDAPLGEIRDVATDLHGLVDERTEARAS